MSYPVDNAVVYDLEVYPGYFLLGAQFPNGEVVQIDTVRKGEVAPFAAFIERVKTGGYTLVGFNSRGYDDVVLSAFLGSDGDPEAAYLRSVAIIVDEIPPWSFRETNPVDSIDLMQILPGRVGLKVIGVRLGHEKLQELPVRYDKVPDANEREVLRRYNVNDLQITRKLYDLIRPELDLRATMSDQYGVDLRSKGEATLAELILLHEYTKAGGLMDRKGLNAEATRLIDECPEATVREPTWWKALTSASGMEKVRALGEEIFATPVPIRDGRLVGGALSRQLYINDRYYTMGVGGLHSVDGPGCWVPGDDEVLLDVDVASYYPNIVLTQGLSPRAWGDYFTPIYRSIVERRLAAKRAGDKVTADVLKISANGTYGKSSDLFSSLYDPEVTANVTLLGQLGLLTLIQMLEGVAAVCSANTDGITVLVRRTNLDRMKTIVGRWEQATQLEMEYTEYLGLYQKDCNNYLAVKGDGKVKKKGRFVDKWPDLRHSPNANIVATAIQRRLSEGCSFEDTVYACTDINQFLLTQKVARGWTTRWNDQPLGQMLRWYKSNRADAAPIMRTPPEGAKGKAGVVPDSEGCVPAEDLPATIPADLNYRWYLDETQKLWALITQQKHPGLNRWAELAHQAGLRPCLVDLAAKTFSRARATYGDTDFTSLLDGWALGTGTGGGLLARVGKTGTSVYRTTMSYPSRTRKKVREDHGFELIYGARVPLEGPYQVLPEPHGGFDAYYTPAELKKVGR